MCIYPFEILILFPLAIYCGGLVGVVCRKLQCLPIRIFVQGAVAELGLECGSVCFPSQLSNTCNDCHLQIADPGGVEQ